MIKEYLSLTGMILILVAAGLGFAALSVPPRTPDCTTEQTRKAWLLADECVANGGDKCWDKVEAHMGCKAL